MKKKLLILCTGNYYRSRFAEHLFNHLATEAGIDWLADSRGIAAVDFQNPGPISPITLMQLRLYNIQLPDSHRNPIQLSEQDMQDAQHVIAVDAAEHHPMMHQRFPTWADRIDYWDAADLDFMTSQETFRRLEQRVQALVREKMPIS